MTRKLLLAVALTVFAAGVGCGGGCGGGGGNAPSKPTGPKELPAVERRGR